MKIRFIEIFSLIICWAVTLYCLYAWIFASQHDWQFMLYPNYAHEGTLEIALFSLAVIVTGFTMVRLAVIYAKGKQNEKNHI
jgi:hypothetical protein